MSVFRVYDSKTESVKLKMLSGKEEISAAMFSDVLEIYFENGLPGIVWFGGNRNREYEVLDYRWDGPRYQDVMIQDNSSDTTTRSGRKGRVAGAIIGTMLMPGLGTVIGAAVGTGKKERSNTKGQTVSHIETQEVPAAAVMKLRDLSNDKLIQISFRCTLQLDTKIRNNIASNLEAIDTFVVDEPLRLEETVHDQSVKEESDPDDLLMRIRELKQLKDDGAITQEEFEILKKRII